jgi:hypothetical protein
VGELGHPSLQFQSFFFLFWKKKKKKKKKKKGELTTGLVSVLELC